MTSALVFMDTETTGLSLDDDIWEFAAIRREPDGTETELHLFIEHDRTKCARLPESFRTDHDNRYRDHQAVGPKAAGQAISNLFADDKPHVVGAVPNFDTERVTRLLAKGWPHWPTHTLWHYHLIDVENLAVGYLFGRHKFDPLHQTVHRGQNATVALPWDSDILTEQLGLPPVPEGERHTAMGDVRWAMRIYDAITGGQR